MPTPPPGRHQMGGPARPRPGPQIVALALLAVTASGASPRTPGAELLPNAKATGCSTQPARSGDLFDEFPGSALDPCVWSILHEAWGPDDDNGGVLPANVIVGGDQLRLQANGDLYDGPMRGIAASGLQRDSGRRAGAAISTRQLFHGGRFEARMRLPGKLGVCSAMWTYRNRPDASGRVLNHEIDIEFPGREHIDAPPSLQFAALTTWTGIAAGEHSTAFAKIEGAAERARIYRFDWVPPKPHSSNADEKSGRVDFFVDGQLMHSTNRNIPSEPSPFLIGVWFPKAWAGNPDFVQDTLHVDWVRITQSIN